MVSKKNRSNTLSVLSGCRRKESAAALVVTLLFLVLIAIMLVSMSDGLRVERVAAASNLERARAGQMADRGVEQVVATLSKQTADVNRNWISQPGQLTLGAETDDPATPVDERKVLTGANLTNTAPTAPKIALLHSGVPGAAILNTTETILQPPNLNIPVSSASNEHLITEEIDSGTNRAVTMRPKWIYVRQDATLDTSETPDATDTDNPIIGRYAFWADDESGKLNINLAWSRENTGNTLSQASPTRLSLAALGFTEAQATAFHSNVTNDNFTTINRLFNSPDDSRPQDVLNLIRGANKFETTHYNHDPDTTFFNEPRIVLTTQANRAGGKPFLDILTVPNTDPGIIDNISQAKINATIQLLIPYLRRTDWPMVAPSTPLKSFQSKYFNSDASRLPQLAMGIIEYVRSVESAKSVVEPLRLANTTPNYGIIKTGGFAAQDDTFIGNPRRFYITEMSVWRASIREIEGPNTGRLKMRFYIEIHLPENYGIDEINLLDPEPGSNKKIFNYITGAHRAGIAFNAAGQDAFIANTSDPMTGNAAYEVTEANIIDVASGEKTILLPGEYRTLVHEFWLDPALIYVPTGMGITPANFAYATNPEVRVDNAMVVFTLRFALMYATAAGTGPTETDRALRLEVAPLGAPQTNAAINSIPLLLRSKPGIPEPATITTMPPSNIGSVESNDPRVNALAVDWAAQETHSLNRVNFGNATRGASSPAPLPTNPDTSPPQADTSSNGRYSTASFRMPYPKGHPKNPQGLVLSSGELGFIHTGLEGRSRGTPQKIGTPWRTVRLQPTRYTGTTEVPDWALMDLFTVPSAVPAGAETLFAPYGTAIAGRVNLNATTVEPYGLQHKAALKAVLLNARKSTLNEMQKLSEAEANTIVEHIVNRTLADRRMVGTRVLQEGKPYGYTMGYDSPGEVTEIKGIADGGEESEELVRSISNLLTTRSNVFSIYSIGQSIKQSASGTLTVTGEQRQHSMVERFVNSEGKVNFRSVYYRNVNP